MNQYGRFTRLTISVQAKFPFKSHNTPLNVSKGNASNGTQDPSLSAKQFTPAHKETCDRVPDYDLLHHIRTFLWKYRIKRVNRMIVRMKLVPRGNESPDKPPLWIYLLAVNRKPLVVVGVRDRCWLPFCRWTICTCCSNLRANLSPFF